MRNLYIVLCLCCLVVRAGAACAGDPLPRPAAPYDPAEALFAATGETPGAYTLLPPDELARRAGAADFILMSDDGISDFPAHEYLLEVLARAGRVPVLGLQCVSTDRQSLLDAFNRGEMTAKDLARELKSFRPDKFTRYEQLFEAARGLGVPLQALNLPYPAMLSAMHGGLEAVPQADRAVLPPEIVPPSAERAAVLTEQYQRHAPFRGVIPYEKPATPMDALGAEPSAERFIRSVALTDSALAWRAVELKKMYPARPLLVLAGDMRVWSGGGLAVYIRHFAARQGAPAPRIVSVAADRGRALAARDGDIAFAGLNYHDPGQWEFGSMNGPLRLNDGGLVAEAGDSLAVVHAVGPEYEGHILPGDVLVELDLRGRESAPSERIRKFPSGEEFARAALAHTMTPMMLSPIHVVVFRQGELVRVGLR